MKTIYSILFLIVMRAGILRQLCERMRDASAKSGRRIGIS